MLHKTSYHPYYKQVFPTAFPKRNENIGFSFYMITFDKEFVYIIQGTDSRLEIMSK